MNLDHASFPPNWDGSAPVTETVWLSKVSQLCFCLSLMQWTMWYAGSVFVDWNYHCRVGDLDSVRWELLQPRGAAESLNMWHCCVFGTFPRGKYLDAFYEQVVCRSFVSSVTKNKHTFYFWGILMLLHLFFNKARKCGGDWTLNRLSI